MKKFRHTVILLVILVFHAIAQQRPNIVVILTDDMGYADLQAFGDSEIPTPNIDRLCREGIKFTDAHVTAPICVASRMGLLTGRYQERFGIYDNVYKPEENQFWVKETTLADVLGANGYRTANIGKWHLSGNNWPWYLPAPHERGFDEFVGIKGGMDKYWKGTSLLRLEDGNYKLFGSPEYLTDFFGHEAEAFIERNHNRPFFLYLAFNAPHAPLQALDEDQAMIGADTVSSDRRIYGGMVVSIDRNVGRVLDALEKNNIQDNTLVIFLNDNGGGGNNALEHTRNTARNVPFRGHKFDVQQGGVRTAMIAKWPKHLPKDGSFDGLVSSLDVFPTVLVAAGIESPNGGAIDGVNLLPYLTGKETGDPHQYLCWEQLHWNRPNQLSVSGTSRGHHFAIRSGRWRAIKQDQALKGSKNREWELYDITRDPSELQDVASEYPEITKRLADHFATWQDEMYPMIKQ